MGAGSGKERAQTTIEHVGPRDCTQLARLYRITVISVMIVEGTDGRSHRDSTCYGKRHKTNAATMCSAGR